MHTVTYTTTRHASSPWQSLTRMVRLPFALGFAVGMAMSGVVIARQAPPMPHGYLPAVDYRLPEMRFQSPGEREASLGNRVIAASINL